MNPKEPTELYVWFAENEGRQQHSEHYIRAWTADPSQIPSLQEAIGRAPNVYRVASDAVQAPVAWANVKEDGVIVGLSQHQEDIANWQNPQPLFYGAPVPPAAAAPTHADDTAVDEFAAVMKEKLAQARAKGRGGWETCNPADLSRMLREHVEKGDPRDVANFCMFLWTLGDSIEKAAQPNERDGG